MTTDNEALKLAEAKELYRAWRDMFFSDYDRAPSAFEIWQAAIQTGRDQKQKELAEMEPVWFPLLGTGLALRWNVLCLIRRLKWKLIL